MEDRRIVKTKRSLKSALISMLAKEDFEHISITELCRRAEISRITFYSHYNDKYALLDDIFSDMLQFRTVRKITIVGRKKIIRQASWQRGM